MKNYELMVIIKPDIGIDEIEGQLNTIKELITSNKGDVSFEDHWGMRDISYKVKKYDRGYYAVLNFSAEIDLINEMNDTLKLNNDILRHMVVNIPAGYEAKSFKELEKEAEEESPTEKEENSKPKQETKKPAKAAPKVKEDAKPAKEEKKEDSSSSLEDVDAKLKSIIDNPDLNF